MYKVKQKTLLRMLAIAAFLMVSFTRAHGQFRVDLVHLHLSYFNKFHQDSFPTQISGVLVLDNHNNPIPVMEHRIQENTLELLLPFDEDIGHFVILPIAPGPVFLGRYAYNLTPRKQTDHTNTINLDFEMDLQVENFEHDSLQDHYWKYAKYPNPEEFWDPRAKRFARFLNAHPKLELSLPYLSESPNPKFDAGGLPPGDHKERTLLVRNKLIRAGIAPERISMKKTENLLEHIIMNHRTYSQSAGRGILGKIYACPFIIRRAEDRTFP